MEHNFTLTLSGMAGDKFIEEVDLDHEEHGFITGCTDRNIPFVECFVNAACLEDAYSIAIEHILSKCPKQLKIDGRH